MTVANADSVLDVLTYPLALIFGAVFGLPLAWALGTVPAILVGGVYWALRARAALAPLPSIGLSVVAAAAMCIAAVAIYEGNISALPDGTTWFMILPGVVATPLCAVLVEHRRPA
jgi:hypothetical protein